MKYSNLILALGFIIAISSCKKKETPDEGAPSITLLGDVKMESSLNSTFVDPGVTATDDIDGDVSSKVVVTGTIDKDKTGTYKLSYVVSDAAGNKSGAKERQVVVKNDADYMAGFYNMSYIMIGGTSTNTTGKSIEEINISNTLNNRFYCSYPVSLYGDLNGSTIVMESQTVDNTIWSGKGAVNANGSISLVIEDLNKQIVYETEYSK